MPSKAWLLYSIEFGADKCEHGIVLGSELEAKEKAAVMSPP